MTFLLNIHQHKFFTKIPLDLKMSNDAYSGVMGLFFVTSGADFNQSNKIPKGSESRIPL